MGRGISSLFEPPGGWDVAGDESVSRLLAGEAWTGELSVQTKAGVLIPVMLNLTVVYDGGQRVGTASVSSNISERVKLLQRIEVDRRRLASAQASARLGSFELDSRPVISPGRTRCAESSGWSPELPLDSTSTPSIPTIVKSSAGSSARPAGRRGERVHVRIVRPRWRGALGPVASGCGSWAGRRRPRGNDARRHRPARRRRCAEYAANFDSRRTCQSRQFFRALGIALALADSDHPVAVAVIDIDHFKVVTDGLNHSIGDQALRALAMRFRSSLPPTDVVVSMSGDGFAVLRADVQSLDDAHRLGNDIMVLLDEPLVLDDLDLRLEVSVGVTLSTTIDSPESLLRDADDAMHQAKNEGRNQVKVFDHHARARAHRRQTIAVALPRPS